jgi:hypothetical protein
MLAGAGRVGSAQDDLSIRVTPRQAFAPVNLRIVATISPSADNRSLVIVADSGEFYRSSQIPLEGTDAPRIVNVEFRGVPGGNYQVSGILMNNRGKERAVVSQSARVVPIGDELR